MKTVTIIIGFRRSGSTILAKAMGCHSKSFALGEINYFFREISNPKSPCGCGEKYYSCPFWNKIINEINIEKKTDVLKTRNKFDVEIGNEITKLKNFIYLFSTLIYNKVYNYKFIKKNIDDTFNLYEKIFKYSESEILIDSTKSIFRALVLASFRKKYNVNFKFIFLVRDGRAVLNSTQKGFYVINQKDGSTDKTNVRTKDPKIEVKRWRFTNVLYTILLKLFRRKNYIKVKHEDFCNYPDKTLETICNFLNIEFEPEMTNLGMHQNHILGGNTSRINAKEIRKDDEKWRSNLSEASLKMFRRKAGWLNNLLGY